MASDKLKVSANYLRNEKNLAGCRYFKVLFNYKASEKLKVK